MAININLLVIFTIIGGLFIIFGHKLLTRFQALRYILGIGLLILGVLRLFNIHIAIVD